MINIFMKYLGLPKSSSYNMTVAARKKNKNNQQQIKIDTALAALSLISDTVIKLLEDKQPVDNTLMLLAWKFLEYKNFTVDKNENSKKTSIELTVEYPNIKQNDLWDALRNASSEALEYESQLKARDYLWFKKYIFNSNIWYQDAKITNLQFRKKQSINNKKIKSKTSAYKESLLYSELSNMIDGKLTKQKLFLKNSIDAIINGKTGKNEPKFWNTIVNYDEFIICRSRDGGTGNEQEASIRQDYVCFFCVFFEFCVFSCVFFCCDVCLFCVVFC